jgi:hypothetical protein
MSFLIILEGEGWGCESSNHYHDFVPAKELFRWLRRCPTSIRQWNQVCCFEVSVHVYNEWLDWHRTWVVFSTMLWLVDCWPLLWDSLYLLLIFVKQFDILEWYVGSIINVVIGWIHFQRISLVELLIFGNGMKRIDWIDCRHIGVGNLIYEINNKKSETKVYSYPL